MSEIVYAPRPTYSHRARYAWPPLLFIIHATRGHTSLDLQDDATVPWFTAPLGMGGAGDRGGWSPTADALVSADEDRCWIFEQSIADLRRFHSTWSAGYGRYGASLEWGADERAISIEVAQSDLLEPYSEDTLRRLVFLIRTIEATLGFKVPRQRIEYWDQRRDHDVPQGFIGHEDTENGRKTGKSDPGAQFPWGRFLRLVGEDWKEDGMALRDASQDEEIVIARVLAKRAGQLITGANATMGARINEKNPDEVVFTITEAMKQEAR